MKVFLSGPMGSGKSTVAKRVGEALAMPVIDLDAEIEIACGRTVAEIFAKDGEAAFRVREREHLLSILNRPGDAVVALGGGAVLSDLRRRLLFEGVLITLMAEPDVLAKRVGRDAMRPLLGSGDDVAGRLRGLLAARSAVYAEAHATIPTDGKTPDEVADRVCDVVANPPMVVPLGQRTYCVETGCGIRARAVEKLRGRSGILIVTDENVASNWARPLAHVLDGARFRTELVEMRAGETHKTLASVEVIWDRALAMGIDRNGCVLAVGGGVVGDLAGFAASTILRGIRFAQIPTTVLAMVDSSVGGKTGFNRAAGKNLVGSFYQPDFVLCDMECLDTLPARERIAGLAEALKAAWLDGEASVRLVEELAADLRTGERTALEQAVRMAVRLKARIVAEDERETSTRMLLNFGHTIGHALEAATHYETYLHGEAVAIGMVAAAELSRARGRMTEGDVGRFRRIVAELGLPDGRGLGLDDAVFRFLNADKKRRDAKIHFVMPGEPGATTIEPLSTSDVESSLRNFGADAS